MDTVSLDFSNFSYFAFHPKSSELSPRDQKIALVATILMGLTFGLGHLICAIVFRINKTGIDSSRLASKTHDVAKQTLDSLKDEDFIDAPMKKFREKIDRCFTEESLGIFDSTAILIKVSFGKEAKKIILQFKKPDNDEQTLRKRIDETLNDLKNQSAKEKYEMEIAIVGKSKSPIDNPTDGMHNTYTMVKASIWGKIGSNLKSMGPSNKEMDSNFRRLSQKLSDRFDIHLDEDFNELDAKMEGSDLEFDV